MRLVAGGVVKSAARVEGGSANLFSNVMERVAASSAQSGSDQRTYQMSSIML